MSPWVEAVTILAVRDDIVLLAGDDGGGGGGVLAGAYTRPLFSST